MDECADFGQPFKSHSTALPSQPAQKLTMASKIEANSLKIMANDLENYYFTFH
jgi:hypothetical protein